MKSGESPNFTIKDISFFFKNDLPKEDLLDMSMQFSVNKVLDNTLNLDKSFLDLSLNNIRIPELIQLAGLLNDRMNNNLSSEEEKAIELKMPVIINGMLANKAFLQGNLGLTGDAGTFSATTTILWKGNPSENGITEAYVKNNIISTINVRFSEKMANYLMSQPQSTPASGQTEAATAQTKSTDQTKNYLANLVKKGYLRKDQADYTFTLSLADGRLTLNGIDVTNKSVSDLFSTPDGAGQEEFIVGPATTAVPLTGSQISPIPSTPAAVPPPSPAAPTTGN